MECGQDTFPPSLSHPALSSGRIPAAGQTPWAGHSSLGKKAEAFWKGTPGHPGAAEPRHSPCTDPEFLVHQPIFGVLIKLLLGVHIDPIGKEISHYLGGNSRGTGEGQDLHSQQGLSAAHQSQQCPAAASSLSILNTAHLGHRDLCSVPTHPPRACPGTSARAWCPDTAQAESGMKLHELDVVVFSNP